MKRLEKVRGKSESVYVPKKMEAEVELWVKERRKKKKLLKEMDEMDEHSNSVRKTHNGEKYSYYYALEAKLVTEDGKRLSLATVFIETEKDFDKEDCELNEFYRLEKILKKRFFRTRMCMLLDGLYANKSVLPIISGGV